MSEQGTSLGWEEAGQGVEESLGLRLRRAREARGWSVADVAAKLRLKHVIVDALEAERVSNLGAPVFVRGYYASYAKLLGVGMDRIDDLIGREALPEPVLSTSARISTGRHLFDRYAHRAVYLVVTVSIFVPLILLATRDHLPESGALLAPLDTPLKEERTVAIEVPATQGAPASESQMPISVPVPVVEQQQPVMASLAPFYSPSRVAAPATPGLAPAEDTNGLVLRFSGDSWVEVIGRNGKRLEHNLVRAGESRRFDRAAVASVLLGNAAGVEALLDGEEVNLEPFRRANVARFEVSSDGSLAPGG